MTAIGDADRALGRGKTIRVGQTAFTWSGERQVVTWLDDVVTAAIGLLGVVAMYWDAWRHNTEAIESDSFWSPPHIALYASLGGVALWIGLVVLRRQPVGTAATKAVAIPRGYGLGIVGLVLATIGGVGDYIWHAAFGFEDQVNAFWSPSHQLLFYGGFLVAATPFVSSWYRSSGRLDASAAIPVVLSSVVMMATATYALMHLSPLWNNVAPTPGFQDDLARFDDAYPAGDLPPGHVGLDAAVRTFGDDSFPYYFYSLNQSVAAMFVLSLTLTAPVLLILRRWRPPIGAVTVMFALYGLVYCVPTEFRDIELVVGLVVGALGVDLVIARARPELPARPWQFRAVGAAVPLLSIAFYLVAFELLGDGLAWDAEVWGGVLLTSTMIGLGLACLMAPPGTGVE